MADEEITIRSSSLSGWSDCPRRGAARIFRKYVEQAGYVLRSLPNNIGATVGTAVHTAAAGMLKHKALHGDLGLVDDATDAGIESLRAGMEGGVMMDKETPDRNIAEKQVVRMTRVYRSQIAPGIQPLSVEERLEAEVRPGLILSGQSDVIAREPGKIRDLKTGKRLGNHAAQVGSYALLARSIGIDIKAAGIDFVKRVAWKTAQPDAIHQEVPVGPAESAAVNVIRRMADDLKVFREGNEAMRLLPGDNWAFLPNPSSMMCSAKWCPAHSGGPNGFCHDHAPVDEDSDDA